MGDGVCRSKLGRRLLGSGDQTKPLASDGLPPGLSEPFGAAIIGWVCTHAEALAEPSEVAIAIDYALEVRGSQDSTYSLVGRTPKTVAAALEAYIEVCADARCHKRFTQTWQQHANAPFAEALMELVAT